MPVIKRTVSVGLPRGLRAALLAVALMSIPAAPAIAASRDELRVISIDVEGGAATLFVTPQGHALLIDTGWAPGMGGRRPAPGDPPPAPMPSSAERIVTAARAAGLVRIDYLLLTHYHADHVGGAAALMASFPIGTVLDHGPNRETPPANATPGQLANAPATLYPLYLAAIGARPHRVMKPGDTLRIDDLVITAVDSDRAIPTRPLAGGGGPGAGCAAATTNADLGGEENPRSLGIVARWGRARILALGDTTWDVENSLVCPRDLIGPVDLMMADNHGSANSNSPALLDTVRPRVFIFNNGPAKGADAASLATVARAPYIRGMWQLHFATRSPDRNAPAERIANLDGPDAMNPLSIAIDKDATIRVTNPRTGATTDYPASAPR